MKPPVRAIVGQLAWGIDGGVWATWRIRPEAIAYRPVADQVEAHGRLRALLVGLPATSMLLSVCEHLDPWDVVADMISGVDLDAHPRWGDVAEATATMLSDGPGSGLFRRRHYVSARVADDNTGSGVADQLRAFAGRWGTGTVAISDTQHDAATRAARAVASRISTHVDITPVTAGELRWLYARALRRGIAEPGLDDSWEPQTQHRGGVVAQLTDAVVSEGGTKNDPNRPRHRRYLRVDTPAGTGYQAVLAMADMPHAFTFPGSGEALAAADAVDFPVDWCIRIRSVPNNVAQPKLRRQHRELIGQFDEYGGEMSGAPPALGEAVASIEAMRAELSAAPSEPELWATVLFSVAAPGLDELEHQATTLTGLLEPHEFSLGRPTGGQLALTRAFLPGTTSPAAADDYRQYLLARDLAGTGPCTGSDVGDPTGLLLGSSLDAGIPAPVLFDPAYGPTVGATASLGVCGALGSGKSYFLKRLCWDTVARGGQVVTIDRTAIGEYVRFARSVPGRTQVIELGENTDVCLDPLVAFAGEDRTTIALGFLSLLAGCATQSEDGATLAEAVHHIADAGGRLADIIDHLHDSATTDPVARSLARRLDHYRRLGAGRLAFGNGETVDLDADFVVFWAPHLSLPDRDTLVTEHLARQMLPEQIIGNALLYLVAALGRQVIFSDPSRFGAALYDEAWALLASPHGQRLLREGIRDGRKHNGAVWLASQHPDDLGTGELVDLLGSRFVFRQAPGAAPAALRILGCDDSSDAADVVIELATGQALYRDVRARIGRIRISPPALGELDTAFNTTPTPTHVPAVTDDGPPPDPTPTPPTPGPAGRVEVGSDVPAARGNGSAVGIDTDAINAARARARARRGTPVSAALAGPNP